MIFIDFFWIERFRTLFTSPAVFFVKFFIIEAICWCNAFLLVLDFVQLDLIEVEFRMSLRIIVWFFSEMIKITCVKWASSERSDMNSLKHFGHSFLWSASSLCSCIWIWYDFSVRNFRLQILHSCAFSRCSISLAIWCRLSRSSWSSLWSSSSFSVRNCWVHRSQANSGLRWDSMWIASAASDRNCWPQSLHLIWVLWRRLLSKGYLFRPTPNYCTSYGLLVDTLRKKFRRSGHIVDSECFQRELAYFA